MFNRNNETPMHKEGQYTNMAVAKEEHQAVTIASAEVNRRITDAITSYLGTTLGQNVVDCIERYLIESDVSLYNVFECPERISEGLYELFGIVADPIVDGLLNAAFVAIGLESEESYTRYDLGYGLRKLGQLSKSKMVDSTIIQKREWD